MRSHKQEKLAGIEPDATSGADASTPGAYWDSNTLFEESRRLEESRDPTVMGERELLAEFGLSESASKVQVQAAYRRLAKEHHPDRWVDADESVQEQHAQRMLEITAVYQALRARGH
jgi:DnaJ-domain-containing protein 1